MSRVSVFSFIGLVLTSPLALAQTTDTPAGSTDGKGDQVLMRQVSGGGSYGVYDGNKQWALSFQTNALQMGNGAASGPGGDGQVYSFGTANFDVGPAGIVFGGNMHVGKNLISRDNNQTVVPLLGIEPLNFDTATSIGFDSQPGSTIHRALGHLPYFEYMPMASAGLQLFTDSCQAMLMVRGGGVLGTSGTSADNVAGLGGSYGVGVSAVCKNIFMFNADLTRMVTPTSAIDRVSAFAAIQIPNSMWSVGVDFDGRSVKDLSQAGAVYMLPVQADATTEMTVKGVVGAVF